MRTTLLLLVLITPTSLLAEPLRVFVSVPPQKTLVEKVGGKHVLVGTMVRPGHSPATYDPTPRQIAALADAVLYVGTGVPFEATWMERIRSANPDLQFLDARTGIDLRRLTAHEEPSPGGPPEQPLDQARPGQDEPDPHVWTSPPLVKHMARNIRDKLAELDPLHTADYARQYTRFAAELDALDRDIRALLKGLSNRKFLVFHPAWGYFADTYGLTQVAIEHQGKEPGARALTALVEQAKRENIKIVFVQPQFNRRSATRLARAIGGRVIAIDPLASDYLSNLRYVAQQLAVALQR